MTTTLLSDIQQAFKAMNDPVQAQQMKAYMLNQFEFMGILATPRRQALKAVLKKWTKSDVTREVVLNLAPPLWKLPEREFQYAAIDLLAWHHKSLGMEGLPALLKLVQSKSVGEAGGHDSPTRLENPNR